MSASVIIFKVTSPWLKAERLNLQRTHTSVSGKSARRLYLHHSLCGASLPAAAMIKTWTCARAGPEVPIFAHTPVELLLHGAQVAVFSVGRVFEPGGKTKPATQHHRRQDVWVNIPSRHFGCRDNQLCISARGCPHTHHGEV